MPLNTLNESTYCGFAISTYDELKMLQCRMN